MLDGSGYVLEYAPDHPHARSTGYVLQHRLVAEGMLGRLLDRNEIVHHRDRDKLNNTPENLEVLTRRAHGLEHAGEVRKNRTTPLVEDEVRRALRGRSTAEAAAVLGVHHQTLRNRFPHLLTTRRSPGADWPADVVEHAARLAADPTVSTRVACAELGMAAVTLRNLLRHHKVAWVSAPAGRPNRKG